MHNIQKMKIKDIKPAYYNPRKLLKPGDPQYESLKKCIKTYGYVGLLVVNIRTGNLVGGHQGLNVLKGLGFEEVEVRIVDLSLKEEMALNIALNKIEGEWDDQKLSEVLGEIMNSPEIDLGVTGFDLPEISELLDANCISPDADDFDVEGVVDSIQTPVTQRGDIVEIDGHRLMCGDSTNPDDMKVLFGDHTIDLVDLDWPYNVDYMGGSCPRNDTRPKNSKKWDRIYSDNMPQTEYEAFMRKVIINVKQFLKPGAAFYQWQAHRQLGPLYQILVELDFHVACLICWAKESAAISYADYSFQTEQAVYGWLNGASHYFAGKPGESNLWEVRRDNTQTYIHPCQKPVALAQRAIKNSSKRGDIVFDAFLGSGSVLLGCQALDRRCFAMELDPKYVDAVVRRYIAFVGQGKVSDQIKQKYFQEASHGHNK